MWNRMYSKEAFTPYDRFCVCRQLKATLEATGARHMIIGHTPQVRTAYFLSASQRCTELILGRQCTSAPATGLYHPATALLIT